MISIIIPTYNSSLTLGRTLKSLINQTFDCFECIVIDDRSTEDVFNTFNKIVKGDRRFTFSSRISNNITGANVCRNQGLYSSNNNLIIFLDSDDVLKPFCLEERIKSVKLFPEFDAWIFNTGIVNGEKVKLFTRFSQNPLRGFLMGNYPWQTMSPLWRKEFLLKIGGFDEKLPRLQDVELHSRALLNHEFRYKYCFLNEIDTLYFHSDNTNISIDKLKNRVTGYIMFIEKISLMTNHMWQIRTLKRSFFLLIKENLLLNKGNAAFNKEISHIGDLLNLTRMDWIRINIFRKFFNKINLKFLFEFCFFNLYNWIYFFNKSIFNLFHKLFL